MGHDRAGAEELEPWRALLNAAKVTAPLIRHQSDRAQLLQGRAEHITGQTTAQAVASRILDGQDGRFGRGMDHVQYIVQAHGPVVTGAGGVLGGRHRVAHHGLVVGELTTQLQRGIPCDRITDFEMLDSIGDGCAVDLTQRVKSFGGELWVRHCHFLGAVPRKLGLWMDRRSGRTGRLRL